MSLSERIRSGCEAAPWVCEEVQHLEAINVQLLEALQNLVSQIDDNNWAIKSYRRRAGSCETVALKAARAAIAKAKGDQL